MLIFQAEEDCVIACMGSLVVIKWSTFLLQYRCHCSVLQAYSPRRLG
jgi:hypothetical protein